MKLSCIRSRWVAGVGTVGVRETLSLSEYLTPEHSWDHDSGELEDMKRTLDNTRGHIGSILAALVEHNVLKFEDAEKISNVSRSYYSELQIEP